MMVKLLYSTFFEGILSRDELIDGYYQVTKDKLKA